MKIHNNKSLQYILYTQTECIVLQTLFNILIGKYTNEYEWIRFIISEYQVLLSFIYNKSGYKYIAIVLLQYVIMIVLMIVIHI